MEKDNVQISSILHKTHIQVNEKGTVAAAVTGAVVIPLMGSSMPRFIANRPFVFLIYHMSSGNIMFEGQLSAPQEDMASNLAKQNLHQRISQSSYPHLRGSTVFPASLDNGYDYNYSRYPYK